MRRILLLLLACCLITAGCAAETAEEEDQGMTVDFETVRTDDFSMDCFRFGRGEKTLVILPGLSVESVMNYASAVSEAYRPLTEDFTVYVFDRRNELPEAYTVADMARDTATVLRQMELGPVCLFGASQGGMIAMTIAMAYPDLVSRLMLGSTSARVTDKQFQVLDGWIELAEAGKAEELYLAFGKAIYPPEVFEQSRGVLAESAKSVTDQDLERFVILAEGVRDFDVLDHLGKIACPVLVVGSRDDRVLGGEASEQIAEALKDRPDCELYLYEGYGHAVYDLAPDYKEKMKRFFLGQEEPSP